MACKSQDHTQYVKDKEAVSIYVADPTVFFYQGIYYLYGTGSPNGFPVYSSKDGQVWEVPNGTDNGLALRKEDAFGDHGFWAPQVFFYKDQFLMAYTANEKIAIAKSDSPIGPFTQEKKVALAAPVKQIDPYIFIDDDDRKYLYHVRVANGGNRIYVAEMEDDFSGIKEETLTECIEASQHWENIENARWTVTEGPSVLKYDHRYFLVYSANHFKSKDYAVGYAVSDSPYGPWEKYEGNPILRRDLTGKNGTGHGDFFQNNTGDWYYVFHTHHSDSTIAPRRTALVKAYFTPSRGKRKSQLHMDARHMYFPELGEE